MKARVRTFQILTWRWNRLALTVGALVLIANSAGIFLLSMMPLHDQSSSSYVEALSSWFCDIRWSPVGFTCGAAAKAPLILNLQAMSMLMVLASGLISVLIVAAKALVCPNSPPVGFSPDALYIPLVLGLFIFLSFQSSDQDVATQANNSRLYLMSIETVCRALIVGVPLFAFVAPALSTLCGRLTK